MTRDMESRLADARVSVATALKGLAIERAARERAEARLSKIVELTDQDSYWAGWTDTLNKVHAVARGE